MFLSIRIVRFPKKTNSRKLRNRSSNLGQRLLLKVSSNLGYKEYVTKPILNLITTSSTPLQHLQQQPYTKET
jgi:hypothetical protein